MRALVIAIILSLVAIPSTVYGDNSKVFRWKMEKIDADEQGCQDAMDKGTIIWMKKDSPLSHIWHDEHFYIIGSGFGNLVCHKFRLK